MNTDLVQESIDHFGLHVVRDDSVDEFYSSVVRILTFEAMHLLDQYLIARARCRSMNWGTHLMGLRGVSSDPKSKTFVSSKNF